MVRWAVVAVLCAVGGTAQAQTIVDGSGQQIPETLKQAAMQKVSDKFKDPFSTQFRKIANIPNPNAGIFLICGQVNSKNSYGAYTGFVFFTYLRVQAKEEVEIAKPDFIEKVSSRPDLVGDYIKAGCIP